MFKRTTLVVLVLIAASSIVVPLHADAAPTPQHCVARVVGQRADGQLLMSPERCYGTFAAAMKSEGVLAWGDGAAARAASPGVTAASFTLGIHYDFANQNPAGGSTSTVGTSCTGGWLNVSPAWNNRISSTTNGCGLINHFDLFNLGVPVHSTAGGGGNMNASLNNRVSSIQYS